MNKKLYKTIIRTIAIIIMYIYSFENITNLITFPLCKLIIHFLEKEDILIHCLKINERERDLTLLNTIRQSNFDCLNKEYLLKIMMNHPMTSLLLMYQPMTDLPMMNHPVRNHLMTDLLMTALLLAIPTNPFPRRKMLTAPKPLLHKALNSSAKWPRLCNRPKQRTAWWIASSKPMR